jgi:phosphate-selective porin OprO/OprP
MTLSELQSCCKTLCSATAVVVATAGIAAGQEVSPPGQPTQEPTVEPSGDVWTFGWQEHPSVRFGDRLRVDFRARFQGDVRSAGDALAGSDTSGFDLARRRIGIAGSLGRAIDFQVERELEDAAPWRDVYVDYHASKHVQVQAGKFKLPFGLDENTSSSQLDFAYRSRAATELAPGRDRGIMAHGRVRKLRYELGVFVHDGDNARSHDSTRVFGNRTTAGRVTLQPFRSSKSALEDLQFGAAFTTSAVPEGVADLRGRTAIGESFFPRRFLINGERRRMGLETRWRPGRFSVQSEYARLADERRGQSVHGTDLPPLIGTAWYVSGAWIVTGERKTRGASEPARPLFNGGLGAIELAARLERLRFASDGEGLSSTAPRAETIAPHSDRALTLGVNWSPNRWTRVQVNFIRDATSVPSDSLSGSSTSWGRIVRFQLSL